MSLFLQVILHIVITSVFKMQTSSESTTILFSKEVKRKSESQQEISLLIQILLNRLWTDKGPNYSEEAHQGSALNELGHADRIPPSQPG